MKGRNALALATSLAMAGMGIAKPTYRAKRHGKPNPVFTKEQIETMNSFETLKEKNKYVKSLKDAYYKGDS